ncbi:hypothetical protein ONZ45_g5778 [Pleurotus djamor]|nr:hypothetical protein ONZ45_g5778 [Pleurotus djamor]
MALDIQLSLVPASDSLNAYIEGALTVTLSDTTLSEDVEMKDEEEDMAMEVDEKDTLIVDVEMKDYKDDLEKKNVEVVYTHCVVTDKEEEGKTVLSVCAHTMRGMEIAGVVISADPDVDDIDIHGDATIVKTAYKTMSNWDRGDEIRFEGVEERRARRLESRESRREEN